MTAYRLTAGDWDSGKVASNSAVDIECATLAPGTYNFTAQYWNAVGEASPQSSAEFDVGPADETAWAGASWFGATDQRELRVNFVLPRSSPVSRARLHVAAPGGVVISVNGVDAGDPIGVSAWSSFDARVLYETRAIEGLLSRSSAQQVQLLLGNGFSPLHPYPVARFLITLTFADGTTSMLRPADLTVEGRAGPMVSDSVKLGSHTNWTLPPDAGWVPAVTLPPGQAPKGLLVPRATPAAALGAAVAAADVKPLGNGSWLYTLPANIVGHAVRPTLCPTHRSTLGACPYARRLRRLEWRQPVVA